MNSSNFLKMRECLLIPTMKKILKINPQQFGFRLNTIWQAAISTMQEIIKFCSEKECDVHCAMIYLRKVFDRVNFNILISISITEVVSFMLEN